MKRHPGFTLIELLISAAILAVLSAGLLMLVTGPVKEQAACDIQYSLDAGADLLCAQLVEDLHDARSVRPVAAGEGLEIDRGHGPRPLVRYRVDASRTLRRLEGAAPLPEGPVVGAALVPDVTVFRLQGDSTMTTVTLDAGVKRWEQFITVHRDVAAVVGHRWSGGEP